MKVECDVTYNVACNVPLCVLAFHNIGTLNNKIIVVVDIIGYWKSLHQATDIKEEFSYSW